jgi:hypothetical protein
MAESPKEESPSPGTLARVVVIGLLVGISVFLMSWRLPSRTLHVDEYLTCYRAEPGADLWDNMHPVTYYAYVRWWTGMVGRTDAGLRSASLVPAAVVVIMAAIVAWWLLAWPGPAVAVALVALSSELLLYWRMARYFAPVAAAFAVVMVAAVGYLRTRRPWWVAVMAAGTVAAGYADYLPALTCLAPWAFVLGDAYSRGDVRRASVIFGALAAAAAALVPALTWAARGAHHFGAAAPHGLNVKNEVLKATLSVWSLVASETLPPWETALAAVSVLGAGTLAAAGGVAAWRKGGAWRLLLLTWPMAVGIAWLALECTPREPPVRITSLALHGLPWALAVMALGWCSLRTRAVAHVALAAALVGQGAGLYNYFTLQNHLNPQYAMNWKQVADFLRAEARPGDALVTFFDAGLLRYYDAKGMLHEEAVSMHKVGSQRLEEVLRKGGRVWLVERDRGSTLARQLARQVRGDLEKTGAQEEEHHFLPYRPGELRWRRALGSGGASAESYVTVHEMWLK